ncbi:MAG: glycosyltransferase family 4 protein [Pseudomonadota bacterium]
MEYREDHEFWARLSHFGARFFAVPDVLTTLRLHSGNNELNFKQGDEVWRKRLETEFRRKGVIPKKIVYLMAGLGIGGGNIVIAQHARILAEAGHDVTIVSLGIDQSVPDWLQSYKVPVVFMSEPSSRDKLERIDILFATFWTTYFDLPTFQAKHQVYLVQSDERLFDANNVSKVEETVRGMNSFVTISGWLVDLLKSEYSKTEIYHVPNGVDGSIFFPAETSDARSFKGGIFSKRKDRPRILIEGNFGSPLKGIAEAFAALEPLDVDILFATNSTDVQSLGRAEVYNNLSATDMADLYRRCDIMLKMSKVESFCLPALEAMACGCAVVVAEPAGNIEFLEHERNSLVVSSPSDIEGARAAVSKLIADRKLRNSLIAGGLKTAQQHSLDKTRLALLEAIDELVEG